MRDAPVDAHGISWTCHLSTTYAGASAAGYAQKLWFAIGALLGAATLALFVLAILLWSHVKAVVNLLKVCFSSPDCHAQPSSLFLCTSSKATALQLYCTYGNGVQVTSKVVAQQPLIMLIPIVPLLLYTSLGLFWVWSTMYLYTSCEASAQGFWQQFQSGCTFLLHWNTSRHSADLPPVIELQHI